MRIGRKNERVEEEKQEKQEIIKKQEEKDLKIKRICSSAKMYEDKI